MDERRASGRAAIGLGVYFSGSCETGRGSLSCQRMPMRTSCASRSAIFIGSPMVPQRQLSSAVYALMPAPRFR